jgi:hypothetical protein
MRRLRVARYLTLQLIDSSARCSIVLQLQSLLLLLLLLLLLQPLRQLFLLEKLLLQRRHLRLARVNFRLPVAGQGAHLLLHVFQLLRLLLCRCSLLLQRRHLLRRTAQRPRQRLVFSANSLYAQRQSHATAHEKCRWVVPAAAARCPAPAPPSAAQSSAKAHGFPAHWHS